MNCGIGMETRKRSCEAKKEQTTFLRYNIPFNALNDKYIFENILGNENKGRNDKIEHIAIFTFGEKVSFPEP
jgi:hypothetical protein